MRLRKKRAKFRRGRPSRTEALSDQIKMALGSGDGEGGILTCYFSRGSWHARPFVPDSLKEGGKGRTAKRTMVFKDKGSISDITDVKCRRWTWLAVGRAR